jgi:hypothetical protein
LASRCWFGNAAAETRRASFGTERDFGCILEAIEMSQGMPDPDRTFPEQS